ncbi:unnamed protein product [Paramecium sonneborni]|uniref:Uncharacterized protein n=1 Tax=Paramecium sonneborni TaxID=65129 RepID=A0A8S1NYQ4_9CILI|nr:unnamed protein product [Paramecium sonneborni]
MKKAWSWLFDRKQQPSQVQEQRQNNFDNLIFEEKNSELQGKLASYDPYKYKQYFWSAEYQIKESKNRTLIYSYNGEIIRQQQSHYKEQQYQSQNILNIEQIKYLNWEGNYGKNNQRVGKWDAFWKGEKLMVGGFYDEQEQKIGIWIELDHNYSNFCQVFHIGNYQNGKKQGNWETMQFGQIIGGGFYNQQEQKHGKWTDIHLNFNDWNQISFQGDYKNNIKQGQWNTIFQREIIGGGYYDQNGLKNGEWIDINEQFCDNYNDMIYVGVYENGVKKGKWHTIQNGNIIGGGNFDDYGMKNGKWIEVNKNYNQVYCITEVGTFLNGLRLNQWNYFSKGIEIGGGCYNEEGLKNGVWIELLNNFNQQIDIQQKGLYYKGNKQGLWKTTYKGEKIGEGQYNDYGLKIGKWIELDQQFRVYKQIIHIGEYQNGKKYGQWNTLRFGTIIGGGQYDENGFKIGKWENLDDNFCNIKQVTYVGEYKHGIKCGKWEAIRFKIIIGYGEYNQFGQKCGKWLDLDDNYYNSNQMTREGFYQDGLKYGKWEVFNKGLFIGKGYYDENHSKVGKWIEPIKNYNSLKEITYQGLYSKGKKIGCWKAFQSNKTMNIGGGSYNEMGLKHGQWTDLDDNYQTFRQISYSGKYISGRKIEDWYILYKGGIIGGGSQNEFQLKDGKTIEIKDNFQRLFNYNALRYCQLTYAGEFQNGRRCGRWFIFYQGHVLGGGNYNDKGLKNGEWIEPDDNFLDWNLKIHIKKYRQGINKNQLLLPQL